MRMASGHSGDNLGEQGESGGRPPFRELIQLPRWVVYVQALLLVVTAGVFFVMGLLVGSKGFWRLASVATLSAMQRFHADFASNELSSR